MVGFKRVQLKERFMLHQVILPLHFERKFCLALPEDAVRDFHTPRPVYEALWSAAMPTPVAAPTLLAYNANLANTLGLSSEDIHSIDCVALLSGNALLPTMQPWATCYGGHQFGHWAGQLGDGRAISLGEQVLPDGQRLEWQLKGAGLTPYSRSGDGRAVLRSSLREYVASVAMVALGVPTTQALSLVSTGEGVLRDKLYDGRAAYEMGAIVCRIAPSFLRFGHFESLARRGNFSELQILIDYTIAHHFPDLLALETPSKRLAAWFAQVAELTANLMVDWLRVGFVHGVMNTDNLSIIGVTIDFGPFAWLDQFEAAYTPNTSDRERRYAYAKQVRVARWNIGCLAQALAQSDQNPQGLPLADINAGINTFDDTFKRGYPTMLNAKLGLGDVEAEDEALVAALFELMQYSQVDYTVFFRCLIDVLMAISETHSVSVAANLERLKPCFYETETWQRDAELWGNWLSDYQTRATSNPSDLAARITQMKRVNPCYIPRQHLLEEVIDAAENGHTQPLQDLLAVLQSPYEARAGLEAYAALRPRHLAASALSCSS
jgi:uncharacterized protein YdiU (UPF0061 family)